MSTSAITHHAALDARMAKAAKGIRLLSLASWPASEQQAFLAGWARGNPRLPDYRYPRHDFSEARRELAAVAAAADPSHPLGQYLVESAQGWVLAAELLEQLGTRQVTDLSMALFGTPDQALPGGTSARAAANHFLLVADELDRELLAASEQVEISATALALRLQSALDDFFDARVVGVELDPDLIAKAAAGASKIRLRAGAAFSDYDFQQLLQHEALVHSLTALNGQQQAVLPSLALSSPRITATQEGLAVFAEQITGSIDIERMKRVSLRIEAVAMALEGADFIQVFRYFLASGQNEVESFTSAQRVFRGVPTSGGAAFTKDTVYLRGLIGVHTFFRWALKRGRLRLCRLLFAGKMTLGDVQRFEPLFDAGVLQEPRWLPPWVARANGLAGSLAFSLFANKIRLEQVVAADTVPEI
ncbi:flavohemoglobin expression-modulating QEGLA motif protein [Thermomonas sp.]|uniref:flavohemoglobin expression-modulating QEGLA motif protein n=1 Tax=Thermomonas sp. TaxID=1971895 RepID=UPI0035AE877B